MCTLLSDTAYFTVTVCTLYTDIACVHCIETLYACIVTLYMLHNFSDISDTVYGKHSVTIQCGTVSVPYIYSSTVMTICTVTLYTGLLV